MKRVVIFGFSANPPANHHLVIIQELFKVFGKVIINCQFVEDSLETQINLVCS